MLPKLLECLGSCRSFRMRQAHSLRKEHRMNLDPVEHAFASQSWQNGVSWDAVRDV